VAAFVPLGHASQFAPLARRTTVPLSRSWDVASCRPHRRVRPSAASRLGHLPRVCLTSECFTQVAAARLGHASQGLALSTFPWSSSANGCIVDIYGLNPCPDQGGGNSSSGGSTNGQGGGQAPPAEGGLPTGGCSLVSTPCSFTPDEDAPITPLEFLERAWIIAKDKARELGWMSPRVD
jgi:hypothetical protein